MRRRQFITLLLAATACPLAAWPFAAHAQAFMDRRHHDRLLQLLARDGQGNVFDPVACALVGITNRGRPVPVLEVAAVDGRIRAVFSRLVDRPDDYLFVYDSDRDDPDSPGMAFRAHGASFRLAGGIEYVDGKWARMSPPKAGSLFTAQMRRWADIVDAN
jgi:hypothetical protein